MFAMYNINHETSDCTTGCLYEVGQLTILKSDKICLCFISILALFRGKSVLQTTL